MHFETNHIYHVYNRGNNRIKIFFSDGNYKYLLRKIESEWLEYCDILSYCLMPNHFHFMVHAKRAGCEKIVLKGQESHLQILSKAIGKTLSSYTQAINIQNNTSGNLFQKKTKAKCLTEPNLPLPGYTSQDYLLNCFFYIHQNPFEANLVANLKDWPYSSWPDYYSLRSPSICNKEIAMRRIGLPDIDLNPLFETKIEEKIIKHIW